MKRTTVKPACPAAKEIARGRVGGEEDRNRQHAPQHRLVGADGKHEQRADDDPDRRPCERADNRPAGAESIGSQDGERPEHDPEGVLKTGPLGDVDRDRESGGRANAVLEPHRPDVGVLDSELLRCLEARRPGRRLREVVVAELRCIRAGRKERVPGDLASGIGRRPDPERRFELSRQRVVARPSRQRRQAS